MDKNNYKHIFGPVPSRRLGYSLGVDIVPYKVCSYDCIYCQLGQTTEKTIKRKPYFKIKDIIEELKERLSNNKDIDHITLSGSGEPTLNKNFGEIIKEIKNLTDIPVAVLTNGSLLWDDNVIEDLLPSDLVIPSLDAGSNSVFNKINRPSNDLSFENVVSGLKKLSNNYKNPIWLEIFWAAGVNNTKKEIKNLADIIKDIRLDKIQFNTVARPPCEDTCHGLSKIELMEISGYFNHSNIEVIGEFNKVFEEKNFQYKELEVMNLIKRRPCSIHNISNGLNIHKNEVVKYLGHFEKQNILKIEKIGNISYYSFKQEKTT